MLVRQARSLDTVFFLDTLSLRLALTQSHPIEWTLHTAFTGMGKHQ